MPPALRPRRDDAGQGEHVERSGIGGYSYARLMTSRVRDRVVPRALAATAAVIGLSAFPPPSPARSPAREVLGFGIATNTGSGRSAFVVGGHEDVGNWGPAHAVKLRWTSGNVWTGQVAVQSGTALEYKFITRDTGSGVYCDGGNVQWTAGANLQRAVPAQPAAPYPDKTIFYHSGWTNVNIVYRSGTNWFAKAMDRVGDGRGPGEFLYRADGIGEAGEFLEFIPNGHQGGVQYWDHAPYGGYGISNYCTRLDVFFLQDGDLYNYRPPAAVSGRRIVTNSITSSWAPTIPSRNIRVYLPRGYDQNAWKRYPVLYFHDGQNVFAPGGAYGSWDADLTADKEMSQGRMREAILVGVDNTSERLREYCPPGDNAGYGAGTGDQYGRFLAHNVRPFVDAGFRTLTNRQDTLTAGSSMGGLISAYLGFETNWIGRAGVLSPSLWAAPNLMNWINTHDSKGTQVYLDWGTSQDDWDLGWELYDLLLVDGYAPNADLLTVIGCGHAHNEAAWAARLPEAYHFLLNPWDEPNRLAQETYPPTAGSPVLDAAGLRVSFDTLRGQVYRLDRSAALLPASWTGIVAAAAEPLPWSRTNLADSAAGNLSNAFYRLVATPGL
jgi:hypothetical protein